jgi:glycosyltransferase involved in cell wall biosynthesis
LDLIVDSTIFAQAARTSLARGGIYRYSSQLLAALIRHGHLQLHSYCPEFLLAAEAQNELARLALASPAQPSLPGSYRSLTVPVGLPGPLIALAKALRNLHGLTPWARNRARGRFQTVLMPCQPGATLYHTPFQAIPSEVRQVQGLATVVTIHDLMPLSAPQFFTRESIRQFRRLIGGLRGNDQILCVSEATRLEVLHWIPRIPPAQIHVTPLAASPGLRPVLDPERLASSRLALGLAPNDRVLLSLGTLEPRKNLLTLLSAFEQLLRRSDGEPFKLVLAGAEGWKGGPLRRRLQESPARASILILGHVPEAELAALYSLAEVFVYPSLQEGFGLPPLEAMQCGTPVIVGETSSLPEVVGDSALLIDPRSRDELAAALEQLLTSPALRKDLAERALRRADLFSWERTAQLTMLAYGQALAAVN